jgi:hypothetical protein
LRSSTWSGRRHVDADVHALRCRDLNDAVWRDAVRRSLVQLVQADVDSTCRRGAVRTEPPCGRRGWARAKRCGSSTCAPGSWRSSGALLPSHVR